MTDPDGGTLSGRFEIYQGATKVWSGDGGAVASGGKSSVTMPAGVLLNDQTYIVKAFGWDDLLLSRSAVQSGNFTVHADLNPDAIIQQIMDRTGVSEADAVANVWELVEGSQEDSELTPLTFDEAKNLVLDDLVALENESPDPLAEPTPSATAECEWGVEVRGDAEISVGYEGESTDLALVDTGDASSPLFEGQLDGTDVSVQLWTGLSESDVQAVLDDDDSPGFDDLAQTSMDGSSVGEHEEEVSQTLSALPDMAGGEVLGYRLEASDVIERGLPDPPDNLVAEPSEECVQTEEGETGTVQIESGAGSMFIPDEDPEPEEGTSPELAQAKTYPSTSDAVRYRTFIPAATANTRWACGKFEGDDRGFSRYYSARHRTRASVFFNWPDKTMDTTKSVGATHRFKGYGRSAKTKTASSAGIKFDGLHMGRRYGAVSIKHAVGNPLCSFAGPIRYHVVVQAWRNGAMNLGGSVQTVPAHEVVAFPETGAWGRWFYRKGASSFACSNLPCALKKVWRSIS